MYKSKPKNQKLGQKSQPLGSPYTLDPNQNPTFIS
jgi:hypothetical protein